MFAKYLEYHILQTIRTSHCLSYALELGVESFLVFAKSAFYGGMFSYLITLRVGIHECNHMTANLYGLENLQNYKLSDSLSNAFVPAMESCFVFKKFHSKFKKWKISSKYTVFLHFP